MIALLGLLDALEVRVEVLAARPGGAVDALQHLVAFVAAPVRAGDAGQLEGLDLPGRRHVWAAAEIDELALAVQRHRVFRNAFDDLDLVLLAHLAEQVDGLLPGASPRA